MRPNCTPLLETRKIFLHALALPQPARICFLCSGNRRLKANSTEFAAMRALAMRFHGLPRGGDIELLDTWLREAASSGIHSIRQFAATLRLDLAAFRNAISKPWSYGQTEGHIYRLKKLERAMYVCAGTELIRARLLPLQATEITYIEPDSLSW